MGTAHAQQLISISGGSSAYDVIKHAWAGQRTFAGKNSKHGKLRCISGGMLMMSSQADEEAHAWHFAEWAAVMIGV